MATSALLSHQITLEKENMSGNSYIRDSSLHKSVLFSEIPPRHFVSIASLYDTHFRYHVPLGTAEVRGRKWKKAKLRIFYRVR
jgi:hypothetical protein